MKRIKHLIVAAICMAFAINTASALTKAEKAAQIALRAFLTEKKVNSKIDENDNSVNFQYKNTLFWVTFEEKSSDVILYTLHRAPIKMESPKESDERNARRIENATIAANLMNSQYDYTTYVKGNRVAFEYPILASSTESYLQVFMTLLKSMDNVKKQYDLSYTRAKATADSIHAWWATNDTTLLVVDGNLQPETVRSNANVTASKVEFRVVDGAGTVISPYGDGIRKASMKYIQPRLTMKADKKGMYRITVVITTPDGKTLVPSKKVPYTIMSTVEVDKKDKAIDLGTFGSDKGDFWQPGEYKVTFYEDGNPIQFTTFHVL